MFQSLKRDFGGSSDRNPSLSGQHYEVSISQARFWWFKLTPSYCLDIHSLFQSLKRDFGGSSSMREIHAATGLYVSISQARFWWFKRPMVRRAGRTTFRFNLSSEILVVQAGGHGLRPDVLIWFQSLKRDFGGSSSVVKPANNCFGKFQSLKRDFGGSSGLCHRFELHKLAVSISQARFWWFKPTLPITARITSSCFNLSSEILVVQACSQHPV